MFLLIGKESLTSFKLSEAGKDIGLPLREGEWSGDDWEYAQDLCQVVMALVKKYLDQVWPLMQSNFFCSL